MDLNTILPLILALVAIVPGVWALINQAKNDTNKARLDMNNAANAAAVAIIAPLQAEVARLQARVLELEKALIEKTNEIGKLTEEGIDKDATLRTLGYEMDDMRVRLQAFETKRKTPPSKPNNVEKIEEVAQETRVRKEEARLTTKKAVEELESKSIANQTKEG